MDEDQDTAGLVLMLQILAFSVLFITVVLVELGGNTKMSTAEHCSFTVHGVVVSSGYTCKIGGH